MIFEHVTKRYGQQAALDDVSFELKAGEICAVLGESGAGKTTLLNVAAGLIPHEGTVTGRVPYSYLFQSPKLLPHLTAEGNLRFVLPKERWGEIGAMLARVGLAGKERAYPQRLSGGERQRVAIARAFLYPHEILLMDEPFSSLDLSLKKSLGELVVELWQERGSTVLFVTHDTREACLLARRAIVLQKGKVACDLALPAPYPRPFFAPCEEETILMRALLREDVS